jgi:hypothetical protein
MKNTSRNEQYSSAVIRKRPVIRFYEDNNGNLEVFPVNKWCLEELFKMKHRAFKTAILIVSKDKENINRCRIFPGIETMAEMLNNKTIMNFLEEEKVGFTIFGHILTNGQFISTEDNLKLEALYNEV